MQRKREGSALLIPIVHERQYNILTSGSEIISLSKHINIGSSFEDLDTTNSFLKAGRDFETRFARYFFFRLKSKKEKK